MVPLHGGCDCWCLECLLVDNSLLRPVLLCNRIRESLGKWPHLHLDVAHERQYISVQWSTRAAGATIGALVAFGVNFGETAAVGVPDGVYAGFIVIQLCALLIAGFLIVDPRKVVRDDGTHIAIFKQPKLVDELKGLWRASTDTRFAILIIPMTCCEMALALIGSVNCESLSEPLDQS